LAFQPAEGRPQPRGSIQNQPYQELLRDLPVIENVDLFNKVDDIRFLELLDQEGLFGDGMGGANQ
jgi:hypothetical protein